jgi:hypothetical protein
MADPRLHRVHYHTFQDMLEAAQFAERMLMRLEVRDVPLRLTVTWAQDGNPCVKTLWANGEPIAQATMITDDLNQTLVTVVAFS